MTTAMTDITVVPARNGQNFSSLVLGEFVAEAVADEATGEEGGEDRNAESGDDGQGADRPAEQGGGTEHPPDALVIGIAIAMAEAGDRGPGNGEPWQPSGGGGR